MPDSGTYTAIGAALGVGLAAAVAAFKQFYPNQTKARREKAERDMISTLESERDQARVEAQYERRQHTQDARMIATLTTENIYLQRYLRKIVRSLPDEARRLVETDFTPLDQPKPPE